jgi:hypothetical protein
MRSVEDSPLVDRAFGARPVGDLSAQTRRSAPCDDGIRVVSSAFSQPLGETVCIWAHICASAHVKEDGWTSGARSPSRPPWRPLCSAGPGRSRQHTPHGAARAWSPGGGPTRNRRRTRRARSTGSARARRRPRCAQLIAGTDRRLGRRRRSHSCGDCPTKRGVFDGTAVSVWPVLLGGAGQMVNVSRARGGCCRVDGGGHQRSGFGGPCGPRPATCSVGSTDTADSMWWRPDPHGQTWTLTPLRRRRPRSSRTRYRSPCNQP